MYIEQKFEPAYFEENIETEPHLSESYVIKDKIYDSEVINLGSQHDQVPTGYNTTLDNNKKYI